MNLNEIKPLVESNDRKPTWDNLDKDDGSKTNTVKPCTCQVGYTFLTITPDDKRQHMNIHKDPYARFLAVNKQYELVLIPLLKKCFREYYYVWELSEALTSNGKYYPRLHVHLIGYLKDPILYLLTLGSIADQGYGYDARRYLLDESQVAYYQDKYMAKQRQQWKITCENNHHNYKMTQGNYKEEAVKKKKPRKRKPSVQ